MKHALTMKNGIPIFELKGKIMGGPEANAFHEELKKTVAGGQRKIIIDLGEVEWMNSSGLGMLISALTTVKNASGELKLARSTEKITSLLVITKLSSVFDSQPTLAAAIAAFK